MLTEPLTFICMFVFVRVGALQLERDPPSFSISTVIKYTYGSHTCHVDDDVPALHPAPERFLEHNIMAAWVGHANSADLRTRLLGVLGCVGASSGVVVGPGRAIVSVGPRTLHV